MLETNEIDTTWRLMEKIMLCMLVTHDGEGDELRARPMSPMVRRNEHAIYFLTDARKEKDDEIEHNNSVCLTFADPSSQKYVSVSGIATLSRDKAKIADLWTPAAKIWWDNENDPNIRILKVTPSKAQFWDGPGALVVYAKMAVAALTGAKPDLGVSGSVIL